MYPPKTSIRLQCLFPFHAATDMLCLYYLCHLSVVFSHSIANEIIFLSVCCCLSAWLDENVFEALDMHIHEFINITYNYDSLWSYLCEKNVVRNTVICPKCRSELVLLNAVENRTFHCTNAYYKSVRGKKKRRVVCNFKISALHGTWFSRSHVDLRKICRFIAYFLLVQPPRHTMLKNELEMDDHGVVDWTNFCREVSNTLKISSQYD